MKLNLFKNKTNKVFIETSDNICSICLDNITCEEMKTNCGHCFHIDCLRKALKISPKCPYCRSTISNINYKIKLQKNIAEQFKKIKRKIENFTEYLVENHIALSFTIALPILYLSIILYILFCICELISKLFVNNNIEPEVEFVSL